MIAVNNAIPTFVLTMARAAVTAKVEVTQVAAPMVLMRCLLCVGNVEDLMPTPTNYPSGSFPSPWDQDAEQNNCAGENMPQFDEPEETYCGNDYPKPCRGCAILVCSKHSNGAGFCSSCCKQNGQLADKLVAMFADERTILQPMTDQQSFVAFLAGFLDPWVELTPETVARVTAARMIEDLSGVLG